MKQKQSILSGLTIEQIGILAIAICLLLIVGAYIYAIIFLNMPITHTLIIGIPSLLLIITLTTHLLKPRNS